MGHFQKTGRVDAASRKGVSTTSHSELSVGEVYIDDRTFQSVWGIGKENMARCS